MIFLFKTYIRKKQVNKLHFSPYLLVFHNKCIIIIFCNKLIVRGNLMKFNKLKSIFLSSALAISILFTGCSNGDQNTITNQTQIKNSTSNNNQVTVESNDSYQSLSASKELPKGSVKASVERVVDGDTMKLKIDETGEIITLRLLLVEVLRSIKAYEAYGL